MVQIQLFNAFIGIKDIGDNKMKNKQLIQQFMEENGIEFNKPFWVKT